MPFDFAQNTEDDGFAPGLDSEFAPIPKISGDGFDFGIINAETGLESLPLRISHGEHRGNNNGYGIRHILIAHGKELQDQFWSVQDFIQCVIEDFDRIYKAEKPNRWLLVHYAKTDTEFHRVLVIERHKREACFSIITGWTREGWRKFKETLIWERRDCSPKPG